MPSRQVFVAGLFSVWACGLFFWKAICRAAWSNEPAGPGRVHDVSWPAATEEFAQRLVQRREVGLDGAHMPQLAVARGMRHGDVDAVLVDAPSDQQGARFAPHGPKPCRLATPRQPVRRVPWCRFAGPVPATHGIAGVGTPGVAKPSCLARMSAAILGPELRREAECAAVLRSLPPWFGIEESLLMYARDSASLPTFALTAQGTVLAFLSLVEHFPESWEVHCMAVHANARNRGHGTRLLVHAESWLTQRGVRFLQVKTVAQTSASQAYAETREFYIAKGFAPLEVFPTLWAPQNPALQLVKALNAG